ARSGSFLRVLDLDDLGAEIGELEADHVSREETRHVDDPPPSSGHAAPGSKNFSAMLIDPDPASAQMHSDDSMPLSPRHPGAGRDPMPKMGTGLRRCDRVFCWQHCTRPFSRLQG